MLDRTHYVDDRLPEQRRDPTGTHAIRRSFYLDGSRRLAKLKQSLKRVLLDFDPVKHPQIASPHDQVEVLARSLDGMAHIGLLANRGAWVAPYVGSGYAKGTKDASDHMQRMAAVDSVAAASHAATTMDALQYLTVEMMRGIVLSCGIGIMAGDRRASVYRLASKQIDSADRKIKALVNVAIVAAHANASLDAYEAMGLTHVGIMPEHRLPFSDARKKLPVAMRRTQPRRKLPVKIKKRRDLWNILTAGDDRVCDVCDDLAAGGPYTLAEARGLLPVHPHCRCALAPWRGRVPDAVGDKPGHEFRGNQFTSHTMSAYHGSPTAGISVLHGKHAYFTQDPKVARDYARMELLGAQHGFEGERRPTVYKVEINAGEPLDLRKSEHREIYQSLRAEHNAKQTDPDARLPPLHSEGFIHSHNGVPGFGNAMQILELANAKHGFNAMLASEGSQGMSIIVREPGKHVSIVGEHGVTPDALDAGNPHHKGSGPGGGEFTFGGTPQQMARRLSGWPSGEALPDDMVESIKSAHKTADEMAKKHGFPRNKIRIAYEETSSDFQTQGHYSPDHKSITIFLKHTKDSEVRGVLAHELTHAKYDAVGEEVLQQHNPKKLLASGYGISPYANGFVAEYKKNPGTWTQRNAIEECLSEMARKESEIGRLPGKPEWQSLYNDINRHYTKKLKSGQ